MSDPFIGEIRIWACNYPPVGWATCNGRTLLVAQFNALYAIIGTLYGGTAGQNFNLPDLRGTAPMDAGNPNSNWTGTGLPTSIPVASKLGASTVTLNNGNFPQHTHQAVSSVIGNVAQMTATPSSTTYLSRTAQPGTSYSAWNTAQNYDTTMSPVMVQPAGATAPHENRQPFLALNFCIALDGMWPQKPS
jgi:microcystin-dependent protein